MHVAAGCCAPPLRAAESRVICSAQAHLVVEGGLAPREAVTLLRWSVDHAVIAPGRGSPRVTILRRAAWANVLQNRAEGQEPRRRRRQGPRRAGRRFARINLSRDPEIDQSISAQRWLCMHMILNGYGWIGDRCMRAPSLECIGAELTTYQSVEGRGGRKRNHKQQWSLLGAFLTNSHASVPRPSVVHSPNSTLSFTHLLASTATATVSTSGGLARSDHVPSSVWQCTGDG